MTHIDYDENEFLEYMRGKKKRLVKKYRKDSTLGTYITNLKTFFSFYEKELKDLNSQDILEYKSFLKSKNYANGTINVKLTAIAQLIKFLNNKKGYKLYNIRIEKIDIPKKEFLEETVITREQFAEIQEKCRRKNDYRSLAIFNTLYYTGCRVSELSQIELRHLKDGKANITGKGDVSRNIYLSNPLLMRTIKAYLKVRLNTSVSLFNGKNGALTVRRVQQLWENYCALTGLMGIGIHSLRHLYAIEYMKSNNDLIELQKRLGHKHRDTTEIYLVKKEENIREQIAKIK